MSQKIALYRSGETVPRCYLKRKAAEKKVRCAGYRWRDSLAIEEGPATSLRKILLGFVNGPDAGITQWYPADSGGYLVMQLNTPRGLSA